MNTRTENLKKPALLRVIFILNALKIILAFVFYVVLKDKTDFAFDPIYILYTAIAYALLFVGIVASILKKNIWAMRIVILIDFVVSIPTTAIIGLVISALSFGLSFSTKIKAYFADK